MAGWNFRKRVKIAPGVHLNFSRNGVSTSVGPRGAKMTFGPNGTYLNTGIPGTGLYKRQKIGGKSTPSYSPSKSTGSSSSSGNGCANFFLFIGLWFALCVIAVMCSKSEEPLNNVTVWGSAGAAIGIILFFKLIGNISAGSSEKSKVKDQVESLSPSDTSDKANILRAHALYLKDSKNPEAYFDATKSASSSEMFAYEDFCEAFAECLNMSAVWQLEQSVSNEGSKLWANTSVVKKLVSWCMADNRHYVLPNPTPAINTLANGPIYFFPQFAIHYTNDAVYEIWQYNQIQLSVDYVRFQESESAAPKDSERLGETWTYVNKNGGPDRRYSYNPVMPILKYGVVNIETPAGTFKYYTSQYDCVVKMGRAFENLKNPPEVNEHEDVQPVSTVKQDIPSMKPTTKASTTLTRQYFEGVTDAVKKLNDFVNSQIETPEMQKVLEESTIELDFGKGVLTDKKEILQMLVWLDMILGHVRMGHKINTKEPQSLGLLLYYYLTQSGETIPYEGMRILSADLYTSANEAINNLVKPLNSQPQHELIFQTARLLDKCGQDDLESFKIIMYRYFSLVSKGDGSVTPLEENFLSSIMSISNAPQKADSHNVDSKSSSATSVIKDAATSSPMQALNELIGLASVKQEVETLTNFIKIQQMRAQKGLKASSVSYHCVFTGNPGTGKTTVARIVASIYKEMGILKKGHLVETDRAGLVAEYVGQTAVKTNKKIDEALDGVLFIDEAYSLIGQGQDYGKEAIATLLKRMEDDRDRLVVIIAGYTKEMKDFIDTNPGLQSRFNRYIDFPDYSADELLQIFEFSLKKYEYVLTEDAKVALQDFFVNAVANKDKNFGNARFVRNTFEKTLEHQANRLASVGGLTTEKLSQIEVSDLPLK